MNRKERTTAIIQAFDSCAASFCERTEGIFFELASQYKSGEEIEDLKYRRAYVFYHSFLVEFKYTTHAPLGVVNSILECMIHTNKNKEGIAIPFALFLDYIDIGTTQPLSVPGVLDSEGMKEAFDLIGGVLELHMREIAEALKERDKIECAFFDEASAVLNTKIDEFNAEFYINDGFYSFFTLRFCSSAFINYIKGDTKTAIKQLRKIKKKIGYETRTLMLWERGETVELSGLSKLQEGLEPYNKSGIVSVNKKETVAMFLSWLVLTVLFSAGYLTLFFLLYAVENANAVYLMGPIYNAPYCILAAFITSIAASYFARFRFYKWLFPKDYEKYCAADQVNNGKGGDKLIKGMLVVLVICSLAGTVLFTRFGVKFLEDGFVDNTKFFSVSGQYYQYDDIERVYYMPNRVNGFGETIEYSSYVIVLKDGREIDLYEYDEIEKYEGPLLGHLKKKGVSVEKE